MGDEPQLLAFLNAALERTGIRREDLVMARKRPRRLAAPCLAAARTPNNSRNVRGYIP
jgi:hypothetical protein